MSTLDLPFATYFDIEKAYKSIHSLGDWMGIRFHQEINQHRSFQNEKSKSQSVGIDCGVMIEAMIDGQIAYAGTSDLTTEGILKAAQQAIQLAKSTAPHKSFPFSQKVRPTSRGTYKSPSKLSFDKMSLGEFSDFLIQATRHLKVSDQIVSAQADAILNETQIQYINSSGANIDQKFLLTNHNFQVVAVEGGHTQRRSLNGQVARSYQSGIEIFDKENLFQLCEQTGREALELLKAENCPTGTFDLILAPDQMLLQIHESIGHPLELDRILGDERNYAGWSFIKPTDFGSLQYGSSLMNVTFDPTVSGQYASYTFDESGMPAQREYLIQEGKLLRGLGGLESQSRSNLSGVANFRSANWNRAPIDRMANLNLEPGTTPLKDMISQIEKGVLMKSNISWSIDDNRNKFQFGCEYAQMVENGKITKTLKNPNYRGVTVPFWNKLKAVGTKEEFEIFGSPYCGKGEPSQMIRVGHASPPCLFSDIEIFGGE